MAEVETEVTEDEGQSDRNSDNADDVSDANGEDVVVADDITVPVEATYYTAFCPTGCIGITATGVDVSETIYHEGKRVIAVDPAVIPLGSTVKVRTDNGETFKATAQDTGGAINGNSIDILVASKDEARRLGRVQGTVELLD